MVWGCIDRVELQGRFSGVDHVVPGAGRDEEGVTPADRVPEMKLAFTGAHQDGPLALLQTEELVGVGMYLQSDFATGGDTHQCKLQMAAGP